MSSKKTPDQQSSYIERMTATAPMLSEKEEDELLRQAENGNEKAKNSLLHAYLPFILSIAKDKVLPGVNLDDLVQEGAAELVATINQRQSQGGLSGHIMVICGNRMDRFIDDTVSDICVPGSIQKKAAQAENIRTRLNAASMNQYAGRLPDSFVTDEEVRAELELTVNDLLDFEAYKGLDGQLKRAEIRDKVYQTLNRLGIKLIREIPRLETRLTGIPKKSIEGESLKPITIERLAASTGIKREWLQEFMYFDQGEVYDLLEKVTKELLSDTPQELRAIPERKVVFEDKTEPFLSGYESSRGHSVENASKTVIEKQIQTNRMQRFNRNQELGYVTQLERAVCYMKMCEYLSDNKAYVSSDLEIQPELMKPFARCIGPVKSKRMVDLNTLSEITGIRGHEILNVIRMSVKELAEIKRMKDIKTRLATFETTRKRLRQEYERGERPTNAKLAEILTMSEAALEEAVVSTKMQRSEIDENEIAQAPNMPIVKTGFETRLANELRSCVNKQLRALTPRQEHVIKRRYGIGQECDETLKTIAIDFECKSTRIGQIEQKALKRLLLPRRARPLREFVEE